MGIDRIGKGGPPAPSKPVSGPTRSGEASKPFEVRPALPTEASAVAGVARPAASPLERLRAGEIDLDRYLDLKVDDATAHLQGLRGQELEGIKSLLRDQLAGDPALADLVQQATGLLPTPKE